jgi:hypothetical protein
MHKKTTKMMPFCNIEICAKYFVFNVTIFIVISITARNVSDGVTNPALTLGAAIFA